MNWRQSAERTGSTAWRLSINPKSPTLWPTTSTERHSCNWTPNSGSRLKTCAVILASVFCTCAASPGVSSNETELPLEGIANDIIALSQGEVAPFDGDLYPIDVSIRFGLEVEGCAERAAVELDHAKALYRIEIQRQIELAEADARADRARLELLTAELAEATAWYRSPAFVATIAASIAVATLLTSTILVQATGEVRP